jgi:hypothetical protein
MAEDIEDRLADVERRLAILEQRLLAGPAPVDATAKQLSIQEFLASKNPKTDVARTLTVGFYVERFARMSPFNINDLKDAFRQAREPLPANLNDAVNKNIQKGLIMEVGERKGGLKSWVLTATGESLVSSKPGRE